MMDAKAISKAIRMKRKNLLKPDMDYAGQEALDPCATDEIKQNAEISATLDAPDHEKPSDEAMGEGSSSQDESKRKKISARIASYFGGL